MTKLLIDEATLRRAAGNTYFKRGSGYFQSGRVRSLTLDGRGATAVVDGTMPYRVRLAVRGGTLLGECSCPMGDNGVFCKHCVATGLAWVHATADSADRANELDAADITDEELRAFLIAQDPEWLADMLLAVAKNLPDSGTVLLRELAAACHLAARRMQ